MITQIEKLAFDFISNKYAPKGEMKDEYSHLDFSKLAEYQQKYNLPNDDWLTDDELANVFENQLDFLENTCRMMDQALIGDPNGIAIETESYINY